MANENRPVMDVSDSDDEDANLTFPYQNDRNIGQDILILFTYASLGLIYTIPGPNLLAIACNIHTNLNDIGLLFVSRGLCMFAGRLLGGYLIRRTKTYSVLLFSLTAMAVSMFVFPATESLSAATGVLALMGFAYGAAVEGYGILYEKASSNQGNTKTILASAVGAAVAFLLSMPFINNLNTTNGIQQNRTKDVTISFLNNTVINEKMQSNRWQVFPGRTCSTSNNFQKGIWISTIPCCLLIIILCCKMVSKSHDLDVDQSNASGLRRTADWKVYCLRLASVGVMFFYQGGYVTAGVVLFAYQILDTSNIGKTKASLLVSLLWTSFSFGVFTLHLAFMKITRSERRLGAAVFKSSICFISSILLLKISDTNGETLILFIYMFFIANIDSSVGDVLTTQGILSKESSNLLQKFAESLADAIVPYITLKLMYSKGLHAMMFAILFLSLMLFLCCTFIALCPASIHKNMISLHYENLTETVEDGNGRKIRKDIKRLLGGYTDQSSAFSASEEEVLFNKNKRTQTT